MDALRTWCRPRPGSGRRGLAPGVARALARARVGRDERTAGDDLV